MKTGVMGRLPRQPAVRQVLCPLRGSDAPGFYYGAGSETVARRSAFGGSTGQEAYRTIRVNATITTICSDPESAPLNQTHEDRVCAGPFPSVTAWLQGRPWRTPGPRDRYREKSKVGDGERSGAICPEMISHCDRMVQGHREIHICLARH
jgi:hypothetical protein